MSWRIYNLDKPVNIMQPQLTIKKGDQIMLDVETNSNKDNFYVILNKKPNPVKFKVTQYTWTKLANASEYP